MIKSQKVHNMSNCHDPVLLTPTQGIAVKATGSQPPAISQPVLFSSTANIGFLPSLVPFNFTQVPKYPHMCLQQSGRFMTESFRHLTKHW